MHSQMMIAERLGALFAKTFHIAQPDADADLLATGMLDSLALVELLAILEAEFGFRADIDTLDLDDLRTLNRIARMVMANADSSLTLADEGTGREPPGTTDAQPDSNRQVGEHVHPRP